MTKIDTAGPHRLSDLLNALVVSSPKAELVLEAFAQEFQIEPQVFRLLDLDSVYFLQFRRRMVLYEDNEITMPCSSTMIC